MHARFCDDHARAEQQRVDAGRASVAERGYAGDWPRIRARVLIEEPLCRRCGEDSRHVDHIVPKSQGGTDDRANLQALCSRCHSKKTASEDGGFGNPGTRKPGGDLREKCGRSAPDHARAHARIAAGSWGGV